MAFNKTDPVDLQSLYDERTNNPTGMTYPANDNQFIRAINDPASNVGGETVAREFTAEALLDALDPTELDAQQTEGGAAQYAHMLVELAAYSDIGSYKTKFRNMFAGNSATVTALDAQTTALARAEVLFGQGTRLVVDDWVAARIYVEGA